MDSKEISPAHMRMVYDKHVLDEKMVHADPIEQFRTWFIEAVRAEVHEPNMMTLSTVSADLKPSSRVVLLKDIKPEGFSFYTNYNSRKGQEIAQNPHVSLVFLWTEFQRQVRIEGKAEKLTTEESESYFKMRPLESQIGALVSQQSKPLNDRQALDDLYQQKLELAKNGEKIQKPENWGGYLVRPEHIEFWQGRPNRLHDRLSYIFEDGQWKMLRLYP